MKSLRDAVSLIGFDDDRVDLLGKLAVGWLRHGCESWSCGEEVTDGWFRGLDSMQTAGRLK